MIDRVLGLVPSWIYAATVATMAALLGLQTVRVADLQTDVARTAAAHTKALGEANAVARDTERQWRAAQQEASDNAHAIREINQASARAVDARAARESAAARTDAARLRAAAAGSAGDGLRIPGSDGRAGPATAAEAAREREAAIATAGMYAELYGWAAERLAVLARYADEARVAGLECQWSHDVTQEARQ